MLDKLIDVMVTKDLTNDLLQSLKELSNKKICIGVPQEDNTERGDVKYNLTHKRKIKQGSNSRTNQRITNAQLLYIHSNGVRSNSMIKAMQHDIDSGTPYSRAYEFFVHEHGSPLFRIPPRPVLAPAIENSKDVIAEAMKQAMKSILNNRDVSTQLGKVGMLGQNICRKWFTDPENKWASNSPLTIKQKRKNSDKPLIDTGALRNSITYVIRDDSQ
ncbi:hypothetical protein [Clostridium sp. BJN0013]|jgi:hypothetical protein|uniref:hypothetical protein n=1 Tax=Clostridium sp. BJN0013 TaxID=3236840 RepID=UPI0034C5F2C1